MHQDFEKFAARAAPAIFVVLWSTGFIGTQYVLHNAEPLAGVVTFQESTMRLQFQTVDVFTSDRLRF